MNLDTLFAIANTVILLGWLPLFFAPRWKGTQWLMSSFAIQVLLGVIYAGLMAVNFGRTPGGFFSLEQVSQLFQNRAILLAGWIHYGAFDLFVGMWETQDAQRLGIHHLLLVPCLLLTFLFGPAGFLAFFVVRFINRTMGFRKTIEAQANGPGNHQFP